MEQTRNYFWLFVLLVYYVIVIKQKDEHTFEGVLDEVIFYGTRISN